MQHDYVVQNVEVIHHQDLHDVAPIASRKHGPHWMPEICPPMAIGAEAKINRTRRILRAACRVMLHHRAV
jgi:hypothetical protein